MAYNLYLWVGGTGVRTSAINWYKRLERSGVLLPRRTCSNKMENSLLMSSNVQEIILLPFVMDGSGDPQRTKTLEASTSPRGNSISSFKRPFVGADSTHLRRRRLRSRTNWFHREKMRSLCWREESWRKRRMFCRTIATTKCTSYTMSTITLPACISVLPNMMGHPSPTRTFGRTFSASTSTRPSLWRSSLT